MADTILRLVDISKSFAGVHALREVSFDLRPGEVHALLGENGAGKSTLIKVIAGVYQPDSGEIRLDGEAIRFADPRASRQHGIAAIYQEPSLFPDLDIAENIFVGRQPTGPGRWVDWRQMTVQAQALLARLGVYLDLKQKARSLSVAQQQMVEIARALSVNARILIMDEPTSSLTLNEVADLFRIVHQLRAEGTAIIYISHRLEDLFELADRVTVLRDGAYVATRDMQDVTREDLIRMMVGRTITDLFPKLDVPAGEVVLEVEHLSLSGVFEDVSFQLHRGETLGLSGLIGAGRTELGHTLFGMTRADSGTIRLDGRPLALRSNRDAVAAGIAYVSEDRLALGLVQPQSIADNMVISVLPRISASNGLISRGRKRDLVGKWLQSLAVKIGRPEDAVSTLSGGNQQRVVLAKWLATEPKVLVLDAPTVGVDVGARAGIFAIVRQLAEQGLAILLISDEVPEVYFNADRVLHMAAGRIVREYDPRQIDLRAMEEAVYG